MTKLILLFALCANLALGAMIVLDGCAPTAPRLNRSSVEVEIQSLNDYYSGRSFGAAFNPLWYDSVRTFESYDTVRTRPFVESVFRFRQRDSSERASAIEFDAKRKIFLHDLNVLKLTADTTK